MQKNTEGYRVNNRLQQKITCYYCFEEFEIDVELNLDFPRHNTEIYDCVVCCNPNKLSYEIYAGEIRFLTVSDGNE